MQKKIKNHVEFLEERLIPDLKEPGSTYTAQDFEKCIRHIKELDGKIQKLIAEIDDTFKRKQKAKK